MTVPERQATVSWETLHRPSSIHSPRHNQMAKRLTYAYTCKILLVLICRFFGMCYWSVCSPFHLWYTVSAWSLLDMNSSLASTRNPISPVSFRVYWRFAVASWAGTPHTVLTFMPQPCWLFRTPFLTPGAQSSGVRSPHTLSSTASPGD